VELLPGILLLAVVVLFVGIALDAAYRKSEAERELIEAAAYYEQQVPALGRRFPLTLYYSVAPDVLRIEVVAHQSRRPGYWRPRDDR
jgi:hypothetical protein